ncbi:MAG: response regulator [Gallionellaceae bacterium]|nr:MAG: response regulator [Gallionellaceae bacterium]
MSKTIMIVDDSASTRQLVSLVLGGAGYEVIESCDRKDALAKLNGRKVHLIISDVNVPNMDGISFVQAVRGLPEHKFSPIVMLSMGLVSSSREQARESGVKAWISKPVDKPQLLDAVARFALP